jgi:hypothetical protein
MEFADPDAIGDGFTKNAGRCVESSDAVRPAGGRLVSNPINNHGQIEQQLRLPSPVITNDGVYYRLGAVTGGVASPALTAPQILNKTT